MFGMVEKGKIKVKMWNVPEKKASTFIPILRKHFYTQSKIWSDQWSVNVNVKDYFYNHKTVCHKDFFITLKRWSILVFPEIGPEPRRHAEPKFFGQFFDSFFVFDCMIKFINKILYIVQSTVSIVLSLLGCRLVY